MSVIFSKNPYESLEFRIASDRKRIIAYPRTRYHTDDSWAVEPVGIRVGRIDQNEGQVWVSQVELVPRKVKPGFAPEDEIRFVSSPRGFSSDQEALAHFGEFFDPSRDSNPRLRTFLS